MAQKLSFVICDPLAGVGKKTKKMLERSGHWAAVDAATAASFPPVTEAARAVQEREAAKAPLEAVVEAAKARKADKQ